VSGGNLLIHGGYVLTADLAGGLPAPVVRVTRLGRAHYRQAVETSTYLTRS